VQHKSKHQELAKWHSAGLLKRGFAAAFLTRLRLNFAGVVLAERRSGFLLACARSESVYVCACVCMFA